MKKIIGITLTLSALVWAYGFVNSQSAAPESKPAAGFSDLGNKVICPVMKEAFFITDKSPKSEYKGKVYFFCCPGCVEKFTKEPEKYLSGKDAKKAHDCGGCAGHDQGKAGAKRDCPMKDMQGTKQDAPKKN